MRIVALLRGGRTGTPKITAKGRLASVTDALGRTIELDYDAAGRITGGTLPDGRVITATYDDNGNLTSITPPGRRAHEFFYTPMNQESVYEPPSPQPTPQPAIADPATYYTYNDDGQMETITRPDAGIGRRAAAVQHRAGRRGAAYTYGGSLLFQEAWDGSVPGTPGGTVERVYTQRRQVLGQTVNLTDLIAFNCDDDGLMTTAGAMTFGAMRRTDCSKAHSEGVQRRGVEARRLSESGRGNGTLASCSGHGPCEIHRQRP